MTPQEIIAIRAPQYASEPRLDDMVALATEQTGSEYDTLRNMAIALLVLHWLTLETMHNAVKVDGAVTDSGTATAGGIQSESEGSLSRSYGAGNSSASTRNPSLASTQYGLEYLELRKGCLFLPRNRMM